MTNEEDFTHKPEPESPRAPEIGVDAAGGMVGSLAHLEQMVAHLAETASARACIGQAQSVERRTVIPVAAVSLQTGFGMGFGGGGGGSGADMGSGSGGGGGGGGRSSARVIAVIDIGVDGVKVRPVIDVNAILRAVLAMSVGLALLASGKRGAARLLGRSLRQA